MEVVYRYFPCDGMCGRYIEVPTTIARSLMKSNGTILPHEEILCIDCQNWITWIIDYDAQLLLPSQT